jgi:hypothetical protein
LTWRNGINLPLNLGREGTAQTARYVTNKSFIGLCCRQFGGKKILIFYIQVLSCISPSFFQKFQIFLVIYLKSPPGHISLILYEKGLKLLFSELFRFLNWLAFPIEGTEYGTISSNIIYILKSIKNWHDFEISVGSLLPSIKMNVIFRMNCNAILF